MLSEDGLSSACKECLHSVHTPSPQHRNPAELIKSVRKITCVLMKNVMKAQVNASTGEAAIQRARLREEMRGNQRTNVTK